MRVLRRDGDATTCGHANVEAADDHRFGNGRRCCVCKETCVCRLRHARQQKGELVCADARDGVVGASQRRKTSRDFAKNAVTDLVPQGVVDVLESVEIDNHHRRAGHGR